MCFIYLLRDNFSFIVCGVISRCNCRKRFFFLLWQTQCVFHEHQSGLLQTLWTSKSRPNGLWPRTYLFFGRSTKSTLDFVFAISWRRSHVVSFCRSSTIPSNGGHRLELRKYTLLHTTHKPFSVSCTFNWRSLHRLYWQAQSVTHETFYAIRCLLLLFRVYFR